MAHALGPIRIDLDSSNRGPHDCTKCKMRRIRCDRALPFCRKCRSRSFQCPGYSPGTALRWGQGVASRGLLKGQSVPVRHPNSTSPMATKSSLPLSEKGYGDCDASSETPFISSCLITQNLPSIQLSAAVSPSPLICDVLQRPHARQLLYHYRCLVSSRLPWIDSIDNPWRSIVLPLAMESPPLLFAILSMAAEDLALNLNNASIPNNFSRDSKIYRERAIKHLTDDFATEVTAGSIRSLSSKSITSALAATLVLCNLEIKQPQSTVWRIHLRAARTVIRRCTTTNQLPNSTSITSAFLIQKFFSINVFASMSTFDDVSDIISDDLRDECNSIFIEFLQIMQRIAQNQRRQPSIYSTSDDCGEVHRKLSRVRERIFLRNEALMATSDTTRSDLENIVDMFYHAVRIYSHQTLVSQCCSNEIRNWRDRILEHLNSLNEVDRFCQDLLWPLFIAGTESGRDEATQKFVEMKIREIVELSGHWNGLGVLDFLLKLWESPRDDPVNWIDLARDWARKGNGFMVI